MRIHEFQAKHLLARNGLITPEGSVAITAREAGEIAQRLGGPVVVKAQIHAGGRARAGGIRLVENAGTAEAAAGELLGKQLVTAQTGPTGQIVRRVLVERALPARRELHLALLVDSKIGRAHV